MSGFCKVDVHPRRKEIDRLMVENVFALTISNWLKQVCPEDSIGRNTLRTHRMRCLGLEKFVVGGGAGRRSVAPEAPLPVAPVVDAAPTVKAKPSEALGRDVTDGDIDARLRQRIYDAIDLINPDKIVELMIEREKARQKAAAPKTKEPADDSVAALRAGIRKSLGAEPSRTSARLRQVG